ncbi:hypothetical protein MRX96_030551 [Rhipicephalus microplus]
MRLRHHTVSNPSFRGCRPSRLGFPPLLVNSECPGPRATPNVVGPRAVGQEKAAPSLSLSDVSHKENKPSPRTLRAKLTAALRRPTLVSCRISSIMRQFIAARERSTTYVDKSGSRCQEKQ